MQHDFPTATHVFSSRCHCTQLGDKVVALKPGGTWLDLWKAIDRLRNNKFGIYCDHRHLESLKLKGEGIDAMFGS